MDGITDVKLTSSSIYQMNLVYVTTAEEEYVIPYYVSADASAYEGMAEGKLHTAKLFMNWLSGNFTNHPGMLNSPASAEGQYLYGGGVEYIGTQRKLQQSFLLAGAFLASASVGLIVYELLMKRKKASLV